MTADLPVQRLQTALREFAAERDWDVYHTPKNLVMALAGEVGELTELFQWLTAEESRALTDDDHGRARVEEELADVLLYVLRLADVLEVDLTGAAFAKLERNRARYPAELARGNARKYTDLRPGDAATVDEAARPPDPGGEPGAAAFSPGRRG